MKKLSVLVPVIFLLVLSCSKKPDPVNPPAPVFSFDKPTVQLAPVPGAEVTVQITSNIAWRLVLSPATADWLQLDKVSGTGNATVKLTVLKDNRTNAVRSLELLGVNATSAVQLGKVTVEQKTYVLTQVWERMILSNKYTTLKAAVATADGGYVAAGYTYSNQTTDIGSNSKGQSDFLIVKVNANRETVWSKVVGGPDFDEITGIAKAQGGGYVVAGSTTSTAGDVQGNHGANDGWIVKVKENGDFDWSTTVGGVKDDYIRAIAATPDGGFLLAGETYNDDPNGDAYVVKLSATGANLWTKKIGGAGEDRASAIVLSADGGFVIAGTTNSKNSGDVGNSNGELDFWMVKLSNAGGITAPTIAWSKAFGGDEDDIANGVTATADGGYVIAGYTNSSASGDMTRVTYGGSDCWLVKVTGTGTLSWEVNVGGNGVDRANSVITTADGGVMFAGWTGSNSNGDVGATNGGGADFWLFKVSATGTKIWGKNYGTNAVEEAYSIAPTADGSYIIAGEAAPIAGFARGYLMKFSDQ